MGKSLYVEGISYSTTEDGLLKHFMSAGKAVSAKIILDHETGRSRGFGFVEMENPEDAENAISMFNKKELDGRMINVTHARPKA